MSRIDLLGHLGLTDQFGRAAVSEDARRKALPDDLGKNVHPSVADVHVPFPADWLLLLREISPVTDQHSWLLPYWYRLRERWVLYEAIPENLLPEDETPVDVGISGFELLNRLRGPAPRDLPEVMQTPWVSNAQHEMYRLYRVWARPFWVLQGERGGHQYRYSVSQKECLTALGLNTDPPAIGSLPACSFDQRVVRQLTRLNRLYVLNGSLQRLRETGTGEAADAMQAKAQREIRQVSMRMLEEQVGATAEMVAALGHRSDVQEAGAVIDARGQAAKAQEAIAAYIEIGEFIV